MYGAGEEMWIGLLYCTADSKGSCARVALVAGHAGASEAGEER